MNEIKKILFRVDAGGAVGLGHFFRSLHLAKSLRADGHLVVFTFKKSSFWQDVVSKGFDFEAIPLEDKGPIRTELDLKVQFDVLYVDGFIKYSKEVIYGIKDKGVKVIFYQNLTESRFFSDIFILPSIHQGPEFFKEFKKKTEIYQGLQYFTFSEQISKLQKKDRVKASQNIAVIAGGSDPKNTLIRLYNLLAKTDLFASRNFTFYYGVNYLYKNKITDDMRGDCNWELFAHDKILANDVLISAFGVSSYEFMALGMPVIAYGHQRQNAESANYLAEHTKAISSLGLIDEIESISLSNSLNLFFTEINLLNELINNAQSIIDLEGVSRVNEIVSKH